VDLLVTHGYKADVVGWLATRGISTRFLPCVRGFTGEDANVRVYEILQWAVLKRARHVAAVSSATAEILREGGATRPRVWVVENAIRFQPVERAPDLRGEFGFEPTTPVIAAVGRLSPEKGHALLIEAFSRLPQELGHARLVLFGEGPERKALARLAESRGVASRVRLAGFRQDVLACLSACTLLVNPSHSEGLPNVILEAFVTCTPVVATDVGGVPELLKNGRTGLLTPKGDIESLAKAMRYAIEHPCEMRQTARVAQRFVRMWFSFDRQARRWTNVYDSVLEG
jgi:glycosyltransferase involved in cell wall biosynthesis